MPENNLVIAAKKLNQVLESLDRSLTLLDEAYVILRPLVNDALMGRICGPGRLPNRSFFYGMYEDSLPSRYLNNDELLNSISHFDEAWKAYKAADQDGAC